MNIHISEMERDGGDEEAVGLHTGSRSLSLQSHVNNV